MVYFGQVVYIHSGNKTHLRVSFYNKGKCTDYWDIWEVNIVVGRNGPVVYGAYVLSDT